MVKYIHTILSKKCAVNLPYFPLIFSPYNITKIRKELKVMGYAIFRFEKVKTSSEMSSRYKHNFREFDVANADGRLTHNNKELISLNGKTYEEAYEDELRRLKSKGVTGRKERSDAVRGLELIFSYSYDSLNDVPIDKWTEKTVAWLQANFNPPGHKIVFVDSEGHMKETESDNVKSVVLHVDEAVPHLHAFVVPIDAKGRLNAKSYTFGRQHMQELQTSYAEEMKEFGLKRGTQNQLASRKDIAKYHSELKEAVSAELPEILPGETAEEYRERANLEFQREKIHHRGDKEKHRQQMKEVRSQALMDRINRNENAEKTARQLDKLAKEMGVDELGQEDVRNIRRIIKENKDFKEAVEEYPDQDVSQKMLNNFNKMINWKRKQDREKERKKISCK